VPLRQRARVLNLPQFLLLLQVFNPRAHHPPSPLTHPQIRLAHFRPMPPRRTPASLLALRRLLSRPKSLRCSPVCRPRRVRREGPVAIQV
jgi:hypothetical protein